MKIRTYSIVILDVIFCGCEAWCFTLRLRELGIGHYLENMGLREAAILHEPLATMAWCILRFLDGEEVFQIWRVAADTLNKHS